MTTQIENVWDYPRPPRWEPVSSIIRVLHRGLAVAETHSAIRVLETSHPPVYYIPRQDVAADVLMPSDRAQSYCEFKGLATYWDLVVHGVRFAEVAWSYPHPAHGYEPLQGHFAFYASKVEECWVGDERVVPQAGDFYGGWITGNLRGPFKGPPGTRGW